VAFVVVTRFWYIISTGSSFVATDSNRITSLPKVPRITLLVNVCATSNNATVPVASGIVIVLFAVGAVGNIVVVNKLDPLPPINKFPDELKPDNLSPAELKLSYKLLPCDGAA
jgi:hypothetical protein